jgi:hypothetical protein
MEYSVRLLHLLPTIQLAREKPVTKTKYMKAMGLFRHRPVIELLNSI